MAEYKLNYKEYKLESGETVKCGIAFILLMKLRTHNKRAYEKLNNVIVNGLKDVTDAASVLYGAYLCACVAGENGGIENAMSEDDFIFDLGDDIAGVAELCGSLISKKKN